MDHQRVELKRRADLLADDLRACGQERLRLEQDLKSGRAQLAQWIGEKSGQETILMQARARLGDIERDMSARQQEHTEARLALENLRSRREHGRADLDRLLQEQQAAGSRVAALEDQLATLTAACATSGWRPNHASISAGQIFSPPRTIMSLRRPVIRR